jgi:hypothetical protein
MRIALGPGSRAARPGMWLTRRIRCRRQNPSRTSPISAARQSSGGEWRRALSFYEIGAPTFPDGEGGPGSRAMRLRLPRENRLLLGPGSRCARPGMWALPTRRASSLLRLTTLPNNERTRDAGSPILKLRAGFPASHVGDFCPLRPAASRTWFGVSHLDPLKGS